MSKIINIFMAPTEVFRSLKEKPVWVMAFVIILIVVAISAVITVVLTKDNPETLTRQEEAFRDRGMSDEDIEKAQQFTQGPLPMIFACIGGMIFVTIMLVLFAVVLNVFIPLFGGTSGFKQIFSVVCFSGLVLVPGSVLKIILIAITKSPFVTTSFALLVPNFEKTSFVYLFLNGFDFFVIWEMILVSMGIHITNQVKKTNAYILVGLIWLISIFIGIGFGALGGGAR
jgi:hypothetical protein